LMWELPWVTWRRFVVWLVVGLVLYFTYGFRRSRLCAPDELRLLHILRCST